MASLLVNRGSPLAETFVGEERSSICCSALELGRKYVTYRYPDNVDQCLGGGVQGEDAIVAFYLNQVI